MAILQHLQYHPIVQLMEIVEGLDGSPLIEEISVKLDCENIISIAGQKLMHLLHLKILVKISFYLTMYITCSFDVNDKIYFATYANIIYFLLTCRHTCY